VVNILQIFVCYIKSWFSFENDVGENDVGENDVGENDVGVDDISSV
jgi:hypothetical protein